MELGASPASRLHLKPIPSTASILVGLLWCLALLSVVVIGVLHTARMDSLVVKNYGDRIQAHYLALAGIEKAKALLYLDARGRRQSTKNHTGELYDASDQFRDVALGRGQFRVFRRAGPDEEAGFVYGISDEESRLNVNYAQPEELARLPGMSPDIVAAIVDWRDSDNNVTPGGAEAEYYSSLQPPYLPRNGPLLTTRELLMVRGVSRELLLGDDANQNGLLDPPDDNSADSSSRRNRAGPADAGWSDILTVDGWVNNLSAAGDDRINVQTADETSLATLHGVSAGIARAIVAYRGQNRFESIADLLEVTAAQNQDQSARGQNARANQANADAAGPKVISDTLLMDIADDVTAESVRELPGRININTASAAVLACLQGIEPNLAEAIVSYRRANGFFPNIAWLLKVPGMNQQIFRQLAPRITARSETFRIVSEGAVKSTGARQRIQVIVHVGLSEVDTLSYREDL